MKFYEVYQYVVAEYNDDSVDIHDDDDKDDDDDGSDDDNDHDDDYYNEYSS